MTLANRVPPWINTYEITYPSIDDKQSKLWTVLKFSKTSNRIISKVTKGVGDGHTPSGTKKTSIPNTSS
jgi:hypothetical protein